MRDLLSQPAWQACDLGLPLPDSEHAVSVAMPLWQHVVDYEEERKETTDRFQAGYPRFFLHPRVTQLFGEATRRFAAAGEECLVFPSLPSAARCRDYILAREPAAAVLICSMDAAGLQAVVVPSALFRTAKEYWRYCGETVSSRLAAAVLAGDAAEPTTESRAAKQTLRQRVAQHAGTTAENVFLFPSGMAAVSAVHRAVQSLLPGRKTLQLDFPYVDVLKVQQEFGSGVIFEPVVNDAVLQSVLDRAAAGELSAVFCEMPSNPLLRCVPAGRIAPPLRAAGVLLVVDDTVASSVNIDALRHADIITTSLTKSFSGAGDVLAGSVTLNPASPSYAELRAFFDQERAENDIFCGLDAVVLEQNSRDYPERVTRMSTNAAALVAMLRQHTAVAEVCYPGDDGGWLDVARPGAGRGCLFSIILRDPARAPAVYDALRVSKGPSLGTNFTLCCPYTLLAHYRELDWAAACGVPANLLRVSAGLEETEDLLARFREALAAAG